MHENLAYRPICLTTSENVPKHLCQQDDLLGKAASKARDILMLLDEVEGTNQSVDSCKILSCK